MRTIAFMIRTGFLPVVLCFSSPALSQDDPVAIRQVDGALLQAVSAFLEHFIDPAKTAEEQAALFAEDAQYYDQGKVGRAAIIRDIGYFTRRWPQRDYSLGGIHYITPDPASGRVFVSYEISYRVSGFNRAAAGKAHYGAVIADPDGDPKIEWIKEQVAKKN